jgi:hypothetical protein
VVAVEDVLCDVTFSANSVLDEQVYEFRHIGLESDLRGRYGESARNVSDSRHEFKLGTNVQIRVIDAFRL